jgi:protocatechuate 3,4-dioxygenase, beta subunit
MTARARRRLVLASAAAAGGATFGWVVPALAQAAPLVVTPPQPLGPFYPSPLPAERDNDLTRVAGGSGAALGEVAFVSGLVFDQRGRPLKDVRVEIWQCNARGRYHHERDTSAPAIDPNFQGYGADLTNDAGGYSFKTIQPVPYPGRTPHIHFRLSGASVPTFVTQMYIAGHPQNASDGLFASIRDARQRDSLLAPFRRIAGTNEWTAKFDIVLPARA